MSNELLTAIWNDAPVEGTQLLLLLALADQANDEGVCWPSIRKIAKRCRVSERTAQRMLKSLEGEGLIRVTRRRVGERQTSNLYQVITPGGVTQLCHPPGDTAVSPEPSLNPHSESLNEPVSGGLEQDSFMRWLELGQQEKEIREKVIGARGKKKELLIQQWQSIIDAKRALSVST